MTRNHLLITVLCGLELTRAAFCQADAALLKQVISEVGKWRQSKDKTALAAADRDATRYVTLHPEDGNGLYLLALIKEDSSDFEGAWRYSVAAYAHRSDIAPDNLGLLKSALEASTIDRVMDLVGHSKMEEAVSIAQNADALYSQSYVISSLGAALYGRWSITQDANDFNSALVAWNQSRQLSKEQNTTAFLLAGIDEFRHERYEAALTDFTSAEKLVKQGKVQGFLDLWTGLACMKLEKYPEAETSFRHALANINGDDPLIHRYLGDIYQATNRKDDAIKEYEMTLKGLPGYSAALVPLADLLARQGDVSASGLYGQILKGVTQPEVYTKAGRYYRRAGQLDAGVSAFDGLTPATPALTTEKARQLGLLLLLRGQGDDETRGIAMLQALPDDESDKAYRALARMVAAIRSGETSEVVDLLGVSARYEGADPLEVRFLLVRYLGDYKIGEASRSNHPGHLAPEWLQAMAYYRSAWLLLRPGSSQESLIKAHFETARQAEISAVQHYLNDEIPTMEMAMNVGDLKKRLQARLALASSMTLDQEGSKAESATGFDDTQQSIFASEEEKQLAMSGSVLDALLPQEVVATLRDVSLGLTSRAN